MNMTHLNQDRFKAMLTKLDDREICTSAPKDNLMMLLITTCSPASKSRIFTEANTLHDSEVGDSMQKTAMLRMLARNAHIPQGHHLNSPQQPRIAKYKTLNKGNYKGWQRDNKHSPHRHMTTIRMQIT
jgi:hypothetical protein